MASRWRSRPLAALILLGLLLTVAQGCSGEEETATPGTTAPSVTGTATTPATVSPTASTATPDGTPGPTDTATPPGSPTPADPTGPPGIDWPTYGFDSSHTGDNPLETVLSPQTVGDLMVTWSIDLGAWMTGQPVVAGGVEIPGRGPVDIVYVGTEAGEVVALDSRDNLPEGVARVVWRRMLGAGKCQHGINGVTGTPVIDRSRGAIYAVDGLVRMWALDLVSGEPLDGWPVELSESEHSANEKVWSGGTLHNGVYYTATAGYCGDERTTPYRSSVVGVDVATGDVVYRWYPLGADGPYGGGIWSPAAVTVSAEGKVFVAVGNANIEPESFAYGENTVRLSNELAPEDNHYAPLVGFDVDLSSAPVLFEAPGCPPTVAVMAKTGDILLYDANNLAAGPLDRKLVANGTGLFLGMPAYSAETNMLYLALPNPGPSNPHGILAMRVTEFCKLEAAWQQSPPPETAIVAPPTVANGVVYHTTGMGNQIYAYDAATGEPLWNSGETFKDRLPAAPAVVNGHLFIGSWNNVFYALGLEE